MKTPRLIIFDCDGTLVDSQHLIVAAMEEAFAATGLEPPSHEAVLGIVGLSLPEAFRRLADGEGEEVILRLRDAYRAAFGALRQDPAHWEPLFDGAGEAVRALAQADDTLLGIATGKSRRGVDNLLERFDLRACFTTIQTADDAPSKPHPGMIEQAMAEVGMAAADTVMVGDTSFDMEMARNAGVTGLGVAWGYHPADDLRAAGARHVADDFADLQRVLSWRVGRAAAE